MENDCKMGECSEDRTYEAPITVPNPFPENETGGAGRGEASINEGS